MSKKYSTTIRVSQGGVKARPRTTSTTVKPNGYQTFSKWKGAVNGFKSMRTNVDRRSTLTKKSGGRKKKFLKVLYTGFAIFAVLLFIATLVGLAKMQELTADLPDPEKPFDNPKFQAEASVMYDRNGVELYRLFGNDNRDILRIPDGQTLEDVVSPQVKWAFLAAEDINFYEHPGFDVKSILSCGLRYLSKGRTSCGGSTITQQVVKLAALEDNTQTLDRKLKELVLALQLENKVQNKDKILLLYMNIAPQGGNIYGVKTASEYYFGKPLNELTLAQAAIIASIPNNPALLSPTRSINPELGATSLQARKEYVLNQMLTYKDKINAEVKKSREAKAQKENRELTDVEKEDFVTQEKVDAAKTEVLTYKEATTDIKAPHFVFFARNLLTQRGYNNGEPFTLEQINKGGYKIYTTLDYGMQKTALEVVQKEGIDNYGKKYGSKNAAMMTMVPKNGEILTMVGSKCYDNSELANCSQLDKDEGGSFDAKVNILTTQQQPGSSIKPFVYYLAFQQGKLAPASQMADIPIKIGNYDPDNSDKKFSGIHDVRYMLSQSRNIPAITALVSVGPDKLATLKQSLNYTVNVDPATYGPAAALGAQDVYAVEHANAYATLANGGAYVPFEAIMKIVDKDGNVVFDHEGANKVEPKQILDERAVYMVNDATNPRSRTGTNSPVKWTDKRDMSGKTGTSENNKDNWFINYSPDFVTVAWTGNNDNTPMAKLAFGSTNVEPWVRSFMSKVGNTDYFKARTAYVRPAGITKAKICNKIDVNGAQQDVCEGDADYLISGLTPPVYSTKQVASVCVDQQNRLAREIDKQTGNAIDKDFNYMKEPADSLQPFLDKYLTDKQGSNGAPKDSCDINRSPNGGNPWAGIYSPKSGVTYQNTMDVNLTGFSLTGSVTNIKMYINNQILSPEIQTSSYQGTVTIPSGLTSGNYTFKAVVTDSSGKVGESAVTINIKGIDPVINFASPGASVSQNSSVGINASATPAISNPFLVITASDNNEIQVALSGTTNITGSWDTSGFAKGAYTLKIVANGGSITSNTHSINIV